MGTLSDILVHTFLVTVWLGSIAAPGMGIGLLLQADRTLAINTFLLRWIDTESLAAELDRPRRSERFLYRHHRLLGALLTGGALFVLYKLMLTSLPRKVALFLTGDVMGLWEAFSTILIIGNVLALLFGSVVFFRPSLIRDLETAANTWISSNRNLDFFNQSHASFDRCVTANRKKAGVFLAGGGIYAAIQLGIVLYTGDWRLIV